MYFYNKNKKIFNIKDKNEIFDLINKYKYFLFDTDIDVLSHEALNKYLILKLDNNLYLCSKNYCPINDRLYYFKTTESYKNSTLFSDKLIIKYTHENQEEIDCEYNILKNLKLNYKVINYEKTRYYSIMAVNRIIGKNLSEYIPIDNLTNKFNILFQTLEQLSYVQKSGYIYLDISTNNIIYDGEKITIIDFGDTQKYINNYTIDYFNLLNKFINFLFSIFNNNNNIDIEYSYTKCLDCFDLLNNTNNYSFEEKLIIKDFILYSQKSILDYNKIFDYFKYKYYKYYIATLLTNLKNNVY